MILAVAKKKPEPSPFGKRLRSLRQTRGMTQVQMSAVTGFPQNVITRLETSPKQNPTMETILRLTAALGCTPNDLLGDGDATHPRK